MKLKIENNWRQKTLKNLEKNTWPSLSPDEGSYLIKTCNSLRKIQLQDFTTEDLRIMIGQEIGLYFLMPFAIETMTEDLFAEGDIGPLLKNVLETDTNFWDDNKNYWKQINEIIKDRRLEIAKMKIDISKFDNCKHRR